MDGRKRPVRDSDDDDFDDIFRQMDEMMENFMRSFAGETPGRTPRPRRPALPGVSPEREPAVYGYSMRLGPDGKPVIIPFGNVRHGALGPAPEREPLVDIVNQEKNIRVVAEIPGVRKEDINLELDGSSLVIDVDTESRSYHKELKLPAPINQSGVKSTYNNGILEVVLPKTAPSPKNRIKVE